MFSKTAALSLFAFALSATVNANPIHPLAIAARNGDSSSCDTGAIQCCSQTTNSTSGTASSLAGLLGIDLSGLTGLIGLSCSPLSILGAGGNSCSAQPVCCTNNSFSGLIALGCDPINLNL